MEQSSKKRLKIAICMRQVPDTATRVKISSTGKSLDTSNIQYVINPYEEYALEEAIRIKEKLLDTQITILTLGPPRVLNSITKALAVGADDAIHLQGEDEDMDSHSIAMVLAEELKQHNFNLILFGKKSVEDDNHQIGPMVAEILGIPCISSCTNYELEDNSIVAQREIEGAIEVFETTLPSVITQEKGPHELRYPSLKDLMSAKTKPISSKIIEAQENRVNIMGFEYPSPRPTGKIVGLGEDAVPELVRLLREDANVI